MKHAEKNQVMLFFLLILLTIINGIVYIYIIPPWQSPDEPTHYEYVQLSAASKNIFGSITADFLLQEQIIDSMDRYRFWEYVGWPRPQPLPLTFEQVPFLRLAKAYSQIGIKPPLYYFSASLLLRAFPHSPIIFNLYLLRSFSLLLTTITVSLIFLTARMIFPEDFYFPLVAAAIAAFLPGFISIGTSVSLDPLANILSALFLLLMIKMQVQGLTVRLLTLMLFLLVSSFLVTYKCLELIPIFFLGICVHIIFHPDQQKRWLKLILYIFSLLLVFIVFYTLMVWVNPRVANIFIIKAGTLYYRGLSFLRGDLHIATYYYPWLHNEIFKSFWIKFGWAMYSLAPIYYLILKVISIIALLGLVLFFIRTLITKKYVSFPILRSILTLVISIVVVVIVYYWYWGLGATQVTAQGRHLFISLSGWVILFVLGLRELVPRRLRGYLYIVLFLCFFLFNIVSIFSYILPVFHNSIY